MAMSTLPIPTPSLALVPGAVRCGSGRSLVQRMAQLGRQVPVAAWRMALGTGGAEVPLPTLRGVFGAALHDADAAAYEVVFRPDPEDGSPRYLLRPSPHRLPGRSLFELVLFGAALSHLAAVEEALRIAGELGIGRQRRVYRIERLCWLDADGQPCRGSGAPEPFGLDAVGWPLAGMAESTPCRLLFPAPVRILRRGELVAAPTLRDVVVAGCRRLGGLVGGEQGPVVRELQRAALAAADLVACQPFVGGVERVGRWSASQQQRIELGGAVGRLDLPEGPGELWRLLAALQWTGVGKATVVGLGRVVVVPIW